MLGSPSGRPPGADTNATRRVVAGPRRRHLALSDHEELALGVIWLADVAEGRPTRWQVAEDTAALRAARFAG
jgi:hypothetical protein